MTTSIPSIGREPQFAELQVGCALVPALVGEVFEVAPPVERGRLLEYLLPPLGVLALVTVANGVFANIRYRSSLAGGHVPLEEAARVQGSDVAALVDRLQMVSLDAVDGLAQLVSASPAMASTAAAALLMAVLSHRAQMKEKRGVSFALDGSSSP